jgi:hypothetical protein
MYIGAPSPLWIVDHVPANADAQMPRQPLPQAKTARNRNPSRNDPPAGRSEENMLAVQPKTMPPPGATSLL